MNIKKLVREALSLPTTAISYHVSQELAALYPDKALVEGSDCSFSIRTYRWKFLKVGSAHLSAVGEIIPVAHRTCPSRRGSILVESYLLGQSWHQ